MTIEASQSNEPELVLTPTEEVEVTNAAKTIDIDGAPKNAVLVVKISTGDHLYASNIQMGIIKRVLEPRMEVLKEKHITVLFMAADDDVSLITEEEMAQAGWVKKEPSLIITP